MIYGEAEQEGFAQKVSCGARGFCSSIILNWVYQKILKELELLKCCKLKDTNFEDVMCLKTKAIENRYDIIQRPSGS